MADPVKQYRFRATLKVAGVQYKAGRIVKASEIPSGHLASMLRQEQIEEYRGESGGNPPAAPLEGEEPAKLAADLAVAVKELKPGNLVALPSGFTVAPENGIVLPDGTRLTAEELAEALKELDLIRAAALAREEEESKAELAEPALKNRQTAADELGRLRRENADLKRQLDDTKLLLEAVKKDAPAEPPKPDAPPAEPEKPDDKPAGGAEPPVIGPAKPPEVKAGNKKK